MSFSCVCYIERKWAGELYVGHVTRAIISGWFIIIIQQPEQERDSSRDAGHNDDHTAPDLPGRLALHEHGVDVGDCNSHGGGLW